MTDLWTWTALLLATAGIPLLGWALFWDHSRGRPRCPECWYDMVGTPEPRTLCPECGKVIEHQRTLHRTRRRWRWAWAAILLLLAASGSGWWARAPSRGYLWPLPIELVTALIPLEANDDGFFGREVRARLGIWSFPDGSSGRTASAEDGARVLRRVVRGVPGARPPSERWRKSYEQFLRGYAFALYQTDRSGAVLLPYQLSGDTPAILTDMVAEQRTLPYVLTARTRDRWPEGKPITIEMTTTHWWPDRTHEILDVTWTASPSLSGTWRGSFTMEIPPLPAGVYSLVLDVNVNQYQGRDHTKSNPVGKDRLSLDLTVVREPERVLTPVESRRLDWIMEQLLEVRFHDFLDIDYSSVVAMGASGFDGVAVAGKLELIHEGEVWSTILARWTIGTPSFTMGPGSSVHGFDAFIRDNRDGWSVRMTSDSSHALAELDATRYWKGAIELPLVFKARSNIVTRKPLPPGGPPN